MANPPQGIPHPAVAVVAQNDQHAARENMRLCLSPLDQRALDTDERPVLELQRCSLY
jgi:hypothetical protein